MKTFHIVIKGIVQGVGFRPFVYKLARSLHICGWIHNSGNGVHIHINSDENMSLHFVKEIKSKSPKLSVITSIKVREVPFISYSSFEIKESSSQKTPSLLITPDFGMCEDCKNELFSEQNNRYQYPFITCTNCGPRYSIIKSLPYDRETTTMDSFCMCNTCKNEYHNPLNRRYYSQTNSCPKCHIELSYFENGKLQDNFTDLKYIINQWRQGKIISIKGIGGYLITCDATNKEAISRLRALKNRPTKPFALMYPDIATLDLDTELSMLEKSDLESASAPIVILNVRNEYKTPLALKEIAPNLDYLGVMLPYTPLYKLLLSIFKKPIVATSGNLSNSSIIYNDSIAINELAALSDGILLNNRAIVIPQDDSVVKFSKRNHQKIIIRRSRGLGPTYINKKIKVDSKSVLSMGAMLKSTFTLLNKKNIYISQYLGNTEHYEAEVNFKNTLSHFKSLFQPKIDKILVDKHPNYFSTRYGKELAVAYQIPCIEIQHHKAHFLAALGENDLMDSSEKILGVIWDGTGFGDDGNIWGGEFFTYDNKLVKREAHFDEFEFILGDKMPKEPRISLLSLANDCCDESFYKNKFTSTELKIYKKLLQKKGNLKSTSIGRLFDGVASLLLEIDTQSFEGEAAMQLENLALKYFKGREFSKKDSYLKGDQIPSNFRQFLLKQITLEFSKGISKEEIAGKFHLTLIHYIDLIANDLNIRKVAFSGGVFQNQCLIDILYFWMEEEYELYFHKELSPNDECISFGQLMYYLKDKYS